MALSLPEYFAANPVEAGPAWVADLVLDNTIPGSEAERGLSAWRQLEPD